jgi:nicotinate-nucleotide pyrophosphorylase (carboxylating)
LNSLQPHYLTPELISSCVQRALEEDIGKGDLTGQLLDPKKITKAVIKAKQPGILSGQPFVNQVLQSVDSQIQIKWEYCDGQSFQSGDILAHLQGPAPSLMTAERTCLNFLQTLSATATQTRALVDLIAHTQTKILDTRKTLPGLRLAQKYAVICGGGHNHRLGLFDALLIKENHIAACGSITNAIKQARRLHPQHSLEIEVETHAELEEALALKPDTILLDNFTIAELKKAVTMNNGLCELEASGNINEQTICSVAETGVHAISLGCLTKHISAIDLSMLSTSEVA